MFTVQNRNMAAYSKLIHNSCYEVGHTWNPSCSRAILELGYHGFKEGFKIYTPLYLITAILRRKGTDYFKTKLIREILQSSVFLGANALLFIGSFCFWRWLTGMYCFFNVFICGIPATGIAMSIERKDRRLVGAITLPTGGFIPALCSTFLSLLLERKDRRGILAMYVANLAVETMWRMAAVRGIVRPITNGEVLLFSMVTALYMFLYRSRNGLRDSLRAAIQFIVGPSEGGELDPRPASSTSINHNRPINAADDAAADRKSPDPATTTSRRRRTVVDVLVDVLPVVLRRQVELVRAAHRHPLCKHPHGCVATVAEGGFRFLVLGYAIQAVVKVLGSLGQIRRRPRAPLDALLHPDNAAFAKFTASFVAIFQAVNCVLRWCRNKDESLHGLISGFLAGWSMLYYRSSTIAMYTASKLAEVLWFKGVERGMLPLIRCADIIIYTISTSIVFHAAVFEPHVIKPAYWKFLTRITNSRFSQMNRHILDVFGTKASMAFKDFWPKYDPRFTNLPSTMPADVSKYIRL